MSHPRHQPQPSQGKPKMEEKEENRSSGKRVRTELDKEVEVKKPDPGEWLKKDNSFFKRINEDIQRLSRGKPSRLSADDINTIEKIRPDYELIIKEIMQQNEAQYYELMDEVFPQQNQVQSEHHNSALAGPQQQDTLKVATAIIENLDNWKTAFDQQEVREVTATVERLNSRISAKLELIGKVERDLPKLSKGEPD